VTRQALPFLPEFEVDTDALDMADDEAPFMHATFELLKEVSASLVLATGLRTSDTVQGFERNQAIVVGHMVFVVKLANSLLKQVVDGHGGDLQLPIFRQALEAIATTRYLLDDTDGSRFDSYVWDSLVAEKELSALIAAKVGERSAELPIETRMRSSIEDTLEAASTTLAEVPGRRRNNWPTAKERIDLLGDGVYVAYRTSSSAVHGQFTDLEKRHLKYVGSERYLVNFEPQEFRPQPLIALETLMLDLVPQYVRRYAPEEAWEAFRPHLQSQKLRVQLVDRLHEEFLTRMRDAEIRED